MLTRLNDLIMSVWLTLTGVRPVAARRGAGMLEYALLGLVALLLFGAILWLRGPIEDVIRRITGGLNMN